MNALATTLLALAANAAFTNWWAVGISRRRIERITKPIVILLLIAVAIALDVASPTVRGWFIAALVFSLAGDVYLMLEEERFIAGLASFLVAHVAYIIGLSTTGLEAAPALIGASLALLAIATVGGRIQRAAAVSHRGLGAPVAAYIIIISAMLAAAIAATNFVAILGAVAFYVSDAILGWNRFVAPVRSGRVLIMASYHLGQALLTVALVTL